VRPKRVATYARVSTTLQSPDLQLDDLRAFARLRGWEIADEFTDVGVSGAKESRPELDRLLAAARRRSFDIVLIWKLDRAARSVKHLLALAEEKMIFTILAAVAQFERDLICERIRAGMRAAKARGQRMGRPRLLPNEKELQELLELHAQGLSIRKIARRAMWFPENDGAARHPSPSLVHRYLKEMGSKNPERLEDPRPGRRVRRVCEGRDHTRRGTTRGTRAPVADRPCRDHGGAGPPPRPGATPGALGGAEGRA